MAAQFELHSRVRTLVDAPALFPGAFAAPTGTAGTVVSVPTAHSTTYAVLLDGDPHNLPANYQDDELEPA